MKAAVIAHRKEGSPCWKIIRATIIIKYSIYETEDPFLEPIQRKIESWNKNHKFSTRDVLIDFNLEKVIKLTQQI